MSKVVVIGNGESALNGYGEFVDSCDVVIRMGSYVISGYEKHVGTKTTIYASPWWKLIKRDATFLKDKKVWVAEYDANLFSGWPHYTPINQAQQAAYTGQFNLTDIEFFDENSMYGLCEEMNYEFGTGLYRPSIGVRFLYKAIQLYGEVHAIGFDNMKTGWYWDPEHSHDNTSHLKMLERLWVLRNKYICRI